jgi:hypothetical protein
MTVRVLVIGGYGNFGSFISRRLAKEPNISVIVAGRSAEKAQALATSLHAEWVELDTEHGLDASLSALKPHIVIHTSGPFQGQSYSVAEACIRSGSHYIDLADGRDFVTGITHLHAAAQAANVSVVSGASSVPALTSAIIDTYIKNFAVLETVEYGIATAQKTARGLATTQAVLSYAGKPIRTLLNGVMGTVYGWQGLHWKRFWGLGWRPLGNCDVPDLTIFPQRYPGLKTVRFSAGLELPFVHLSLWALTWLVRIGVIANLRSAAALLLSLSRLVDFFGSDASGFFMKMAGHNAAGHPLTTSFNLVARSGDGPMIPCVPAVVTALRLARGELKMPGAMPCVGLVELDGLLEELRPLNVRWEVDQLSK